MERREEPIYTDTEKELLGYELINHGMYVTIMEYARILGSLSDKAYRTEGQSEVINVMQGIIDQTRDRAKTICDALPDGDKLKEYYKRLDYKVEDVMRLSSVEHSDEIHLYPVSGDNAKEACRKAYKVAKGIVEKRANYEKNNDEKGLTHCKRVLEACESIFNDGGEYGIKYRNLLNTHINRVKGQRTVQEDIDEYNRLFDEFIKIEIEYATAKLSDEFKNESTRQEYVKNVLDKYDEKAWDYEYVLKDLLSSMPEGCQIGLRSVDEVSDKAYWHPEEFLRDYNTPPVQK